MRLKCAWDAVKNKADKTNGAPDVDLPTHLAATEQTHLPQAQILSECFDMLRDKGLLEEAYLRGSLGRGHADIQSDIDLFTVVAPENLEKVYDAVSEYLASRGKIVTSCHDRLVENYGGIGFMFIAEDASRGGKSFQFDLYMAIKGMPPCKPTNIKPRIYSKDPSYKWLDEYGNKAVELPQGAKDFIKRHTAGDTLSDRLELLMQDTLITMYVTSKHLTRGQVSRTVVDNNALVSASIEFMQTIMDYRPTGYSCLYLGDEIVKMARQYGDEDMITCADKLEPLFTEAISHEKLIHTLDYCAEVMKRADGAAYARQKDAIDWFRQKIVSDAPVQSPPLLTVVPGKGPAL